MREQEQPGGLARRIAAYRDRRQAQLEQQRALRDARELQQCTFAPALVPRPCVPQVGPRVGHLRDCLGFPDREGPPCKKTMKPCHSLQPLVSQDWHGQPVGLSWAAGQGPVVVHGLDAFLATKDHARQLEAEQRAREEKAFCVNPQPRAEPFTVPRPFALHTQLREVLMPVPFFATQTQWPVHDVAA